MARLIIWDAADGPLERAVAASHADQSRNGTRLRFLAQRWDKSNRLSASLSHPAGRWSVRFPLRLKCGQDRVLIGPLLETSSEADKRKYTKRDFEYVLGERMVLLASVQHFLASKYPDCLLNPPRQFTGSVMIASPKEQRDILRRAGFCVPRGIAANDTTRLKATTAAYQQMEFLGIDVPTSVNSAYARHGEPYLPRRLVRIGGMDRLRLVTVVHKQVYECRLDASGETDSAQKRVARTHRLHRLALQAARLAATRVCEIVTSQEGRSEVALGMTRTLGSVNLPETLPTLLHALMEQEHRV